MLLLSSLRIRLGYLSYRFVYERTHMSVVGQIKKHLLFFLVLPCMERIWKEVLLIEEGRALAKEPVTGLMALAQVLLLLWASVSLSMKKTY